LVLITKQEIVILPRIEPTIATGVPMAIRMRYNEPIVNQHNGSINCGIPKDWSKGINSVNRVPRPNSPHCTYYHQIRH